MDKIIRDKISIIGGAGHVGFPLGLAFGSKKFAVNLVDTNNDSLEKIKLGIPPFLEMGAKKILKQCMKKKLFTFNNNLNSIQDSEFIIICIGTPINQSLKPEIKKFISLFYKLFKIIKKNQFIIIRSSVFPGIISKICNILKKKNTNIVYCPERIVQGYSLSELPKLPQIIASNKKNAIGRTSKIFKKICNKIIVTQILEAELIKLFSNANRYINFAIANQLFLICDKNNLNYNRVRKFMIDGYERNINLSYSGLTAGPCLLKDTMQLSSFYQNKFSLGISAMKINESFPDLIIKKIKKINNYKKKIIGVLGLTFKADSDDIRDSLAIKLCKKLKKNKLKFLQSDEYYHNKNNINKTDLIKKADIIILGAPHKSYKKLKIEKKKIIIDVWGVLKT